MGNERKTVGGGVNNDATAILDDCEADLEAAVWEGEHAGQLDAARTIVDGVIGRLKGVGCQPDSAIYRRRQGLLAFALMRRANIFRQAQDVSAASDADREALAAAETADDLSRGRCLLSMAATDFASGRPTDGLSHLEGARRVLRSGAGEDFQQGIGWSWLLHADVVNAGLVDDGPEQAIVSATKALGILRAIDNWAGVARSYQALAAVEEGLGNQQIAGAIREAANQYEAMAAREHR